MASALMAEKVALFFCASSGKNVAPRASFLRAALEAVALDLRADLPDRMASHSPQHHASMPDDDLPKDLGRRLGDLSDLPEGLRKLIVAVKLDDLEEKIVSTLRTRFQGVANIDELMVGLYRDHEYVTEDRRKLGNKLYRMQQAGLVESVPKKKGVYKLKDSAAT